MKIIVENKAHSAFNAAAEEFKKYYNAITERQAVIVKDIADCFDGDTVLLCDTKNPLSDSRVKENTDAFSLLTRKNEKGEMLVITGGRPRAVLYGVYAFFEAAGCSWFWDTDIIPKRDELSLSNFDYYTAPRFEYRAIRYFAHRGLHRFQAEHWSFEDWKHEIDWLAKSRLNVFMLRIGMDDLFQKAFPDDVPYPSNSEVLPEAGDGYNNRTTFWSLEYRGQLRKKVLSYAFERDLLHPEDCGTMTHWYSRTPLAFLDNKKPSLLTQASKSYSEKTGLVWDINDDENWKNYQHLTDTHIKEYGSPALFHTIGLAERSYGDDREKNMALKYMAYEKITDYVAKNYPDAPLWIASWDLFFCYKADEVKSLMKKLDPKRHIIFDYTVDLKASGNNFENWDVCGKFPYIFGIFHGYMSQSNVHGDYDYINKKLKVAADDPFCRGMAFWPELSHSDTLMLEYFTKNAWEPTIRPIEEWIAEFCAKRYGKDAQQIKAVWDAFVPVYKALDVANIYYMECFYDLFSKKMPIVHILNKNEAKHTAQIEKWKNRLIEAVHYEEDMKKVVNLIKALPEGCLNNPVILRDVIDLLRTIAAKKLEYSVVRTVISYIDGEDIENVKNSLDRCIKELSNFADILSLNNDYSLNYTYERLKTVSEVNPHFEKAIKDNSVNYYCRSAVYESVKYVYIPEMELLKSIILSGGERGTLPDFTKDTNEIFDRFIKMPLQDMKPELSNFNSVCEELLTFF